MDVGFKDLLRSVRKALAHAFRPTKKDPNYDSDKKKGYAHWEKSRFIDEITLFAEDFLAIRNPTLKEKWIILILVAPIKI